MSRKEFLRTGFRSLGRALLCPAELVPAEPVQDDPSVPRCAVPANDRCLAHRGGCFTCPERCPGQAIRIEPGTGLVVDPDHCTGCGVCEQVCLLAPPAIRVRPLPS